mgnify:CR=1 FL=1
MARGKKKVVPNDELDQDEKSNGLATEFQLSENVKLAVDLRSYALSRKIISKKYDEDGNFVSTVETWGDQKYPATLDYAIRMATRIETLTKLSGTTTLEEYLRTTNHYYEYFKNRLKDLGL